MSKLKKVGTVTIDVYEFKNSDDFYGVAKGSFEYLPTDGITKLSYGGDGYIMTEGGLYADTHNYFGSSLEGFERVVILDEFAKLNGETNE